MSIFRQSILLLIIWQVKCRDNTYNKTIFSLTTWEQDIQQFYLRRLGNRIYYNIVLEWILIPNISFITCFLYKYRTYQLFTQTSKCSSERKHCNDLNLNLTFIWKIITSYSCWNGISYFKLHCRCSYHYYTLNILL